MLMNNLNKWEQQISLTYKITITKLCKTLKMSAL